MKRIKQAETVGVFAKRRFVFWKYFDRNLEPEPVTDSRLPEAKSLQRLTANERALSASNYVIIYTMCPDILHITDISPKKPS
jgi:hypothetical protein